MNFEFKRLNISDVILITPSLIGDERGSFAETYKMSNFEANGILESFVQDNHAVSSRGVLRGLHYQKRPHDQGKLVRCVKGEIYDVAVDIRNDSSTYGKWVGEELTEYNRNMLYVPPGFAHGYVVMSEKAEMLYKCTKEYSADSERGIIWNDSDIGISWPITNPILSRKDREYKCLKEADNKF